MVTHERYLAQQPFPWPLRILAEVYPSEDVAEEIWMQGNLDNT